MIPMAGRVASERGLIMYVQESRKFPMLTASEEIDLARRWRDHEDIEAAHKLATSHLRLVIKIAHGYRGCGLPASELISEGSVGMMLAVRRFDPERGYRFATYAIHWIRAAIQEYILHSRSLVKMGTTAAQKKLFFNLNRLKGEIEAVDEGDLQPEQVARIAHRLDVKERDVISMNQRLAAPDYSLNTPVSGDRDGEWQDGLVDEVESQEKAIANQEVLSNRKNLLQNAMRTLNAREQHIVTERHLNDDPAKLEDLARHFNISRERVRQIETRALTKLQKSMKDQVLHGI